MKQQILQVLQNREFFSDMAKAPALKLSDHLLKLSKQFLVPRFYKKRQILYYEDSPVTGLYYVETGEIKIYKTGPEGKDHILRIVKPGDIAGLESLFTGYSSAAAEMLEEGKVCLIDKQAVLDEISHNTPLALLVIQELALELISSDEERVDLAQSSVRERMARLLTTLSQSYGVPEKNGVRISLPLSREEMAEMIGTASETAMRLLKDFREEKVVEVQGRAIIVLDQQRLAKTARLDF